MMLLLLLFFVVIFLFFCFFFLWETDSITANGIMGKVAPPAFFNNINFTLCRLKYGVLGGPRLAELF